MNGKNNNIHCVSYIWNLQYVTCSHKFQIWWLSLTLFTRSYSWLLHFDLAFVKKNLVTKNHEFTLSFMNNAVCSFRSFMICCKPSIRISSIRYNVKFEESEVFDRCQPHCRLPQCISNKLKELYTSCFVFMGWKWLFNPLVTARNVSINKKRCWKNKKQVILNQVYLALPVALSYPSLNLTTKT
jgi:hypothetical protein